MVAAAAGASVAFLGLLPLLGLLALGVAVAAFVWPAVTTVAYLGALYANIPVLASTNYGIPSTIAGASIAVLSVPLLASLARREPPVVTLSLLAFAAYVAAVLLSAAAARYDTSERVFIVMTEGVLLYMLVTNVVRTPATLRRVIWAMVIAGGVLGGLTLFQELTDSYDMTFGGLAQVETEGDPEGENAATLQRAAGPIGEKNRYAQVLVLAIVPAIWLALHARSRVSRAAAIGSALLIVVGILLTFSRGAGVALAILLLAMVALRFLRPRIVLPLIGVMFVVTLIVAPAFITRVASLGGVAGLVSDDADDPDGAILGRATSNLAALNVFLDHPVLGVGPGLYASRYSIPYANDLGLRHFDTPRRAHNLYIETAAETGILGLGSLMAMFGITGGSLWRLRRFWSGRNAEFTNLATALLLTLVAYLVTALFLHLAYERYMWLILALANAAIWMLWRRKTEDAVVAAPVTPAALRSRTVG